MTSAPIPLAKPILPTSVSTLFAAFLSMACGETPAPGNAGGGGQGGAAGNMAKGGAPSSGGSPTGGAMSSGGVMSSGGASSGGAPSGGSGPSGGSANGGSGGSMTSNGCNGAVTTLNLNPFGCEMAWGANADSAQQRGAYAGYMNFVTSWVLEGEPGLAQAISNSDAIPVYYGYIIGDTGHDHGLPDCNLGGPPNLCTDGARMIRENRNEIISKYAAAALASHNANNGKIAVWLLEGDFMQYHDGIDQQDALSYEELGQLAEDITCAIKSNQPNAVVAMNHTTWNGDDETDDFWAAMPMEILDMVWTTGVGNRDGYIRQDGGPDEYNARTARYDYIANLTQRKIFVDESFGASQESDTWLNQQAGTLNARISEGVIAINLTGSGLPGNLQSAISSITPQLSSTCQ